MSITGTLATAAAVAGTAKATTAVTGFVIKYRKEVYDEKIQELQGHAEKLDAHLETLRTYKSEINGFWGDETGEKYVSVINKQIIQLENAKRSIDNLTTLYDDIKKALDDAQSKVSDRVDIVANLVEGLTGMTE